jgi:GAF domain-containing protein
MGCDSVAFLPVLRQENIAAMLVLGRVSEPLEGSSAQPAPALTGVMLGPYINLIELMATALEKIQAQKGTQRRLAELQMLWNVSQTISIETDLKPLFRTIHKQAEEVMGELSSFAMALYDDVTDTIRIPYMFEEGQMVDIPPFPLGEGLTSIIVRTRRPLMLVEDTEEKAQELGAKTYGVPAKSWLGVPMLFGGQVVGAIIAQDINQEQRFDEGDQRLLSTLAAQVAVVVRNARLLETSRQQTELERSLNEIINKVRRSTDIPTILKTTADELGATLGVRRAHIQIAIDSPAQGSQAAGGQVELSHPGSTDGGE